ncbi:hypothetical protein K466DRAFT_571267, partial [Polyporus arcularius HHB13444]
DATVNVTQPFTPVSRRTPARPLSSPAFASTLTDMNGHEDVFNGPPAPAGAVLTLRSPLRSVSNAVDPSITAIPRHSNVSSSPIFRAPPLTPCIRAIDDSPSPGVSPVTEQGTSFLARPPIVFGDPPPRVLTTAPVQPPKTKRKGRTKRLPQAARAKKVTQQRADDHPQAAQQGVENVPVVASTNGSDEVVTGKRKRRETARWLGVSPDYSAAKKVKITMQDDLELPSAEASQPARRPRARTRR